MDGTDELQVRTDHYTAEETIAQERAISGV